LVFFFFDSFLFFLFHLFISIFSKHCSSKSILNQNNNNKNLLGLLPYNFVCVQAGQILNQLESTSDILDIKTLLQLGLIGVAVLGLWFVKNKHKKAKQT